MVKIRRDPADRLFSYYIRERDNWTCTRCGRQFERKSQGLHCSHFFGRRAESTRFDPENCDSACYGCHQYFGSNPLEFTEWKKKQLGDRFDLLVLRKNTHKKKDRKMEKIIWAEALKNLCKEKSVERYW